MSRVRVLAFGSEPPRPPDCTLDFERVAPQQAQATWRQLGVGCVEMPVCETLVAAPPFGGVPSTAPPRSFSRECTVYDAYAPGEYRDKLRGDACRMGGDVVAPMDVCAFGGRFGSDGFEFAVYRTK